jgi:glycosyltransferase involved in cell wall biosynthesis
LTNREFMEKKDESQKRVKVLFICWGYSIHAFRRIKIFTDDKMFDVAVASNHDYRFENALNILLGGFNQTSRDLNDVPTQKKYYSFFASIFNEIEQKIKMLALMLAIQVKVFPENVFGWGKYKLLRREIIFGQRDFATLKSAVNDFRPDVIFLQTLLYPCYLAYFLSPSIPIIITFWNGDVIWWAKWNGVDRYFKRQIVNYGVHRAAAITVNSQSAFDACLGYGISPKKISIIRYPGVNLDQFKPISKELARGKLNLTASHVILWPRGIGGYLNSDVLISSAKAVVGKKPDTVFLIFHHQMQVELKEHQKMAADLRLGKNFQWIEIVSYDLMPYYYSAADIVISISSNDSQPNCMLESLACRTPVIMGDIPQIREWISDGINGFLVPPRNPSALSKKILSILDMDNERLTKITKKGLNDVKQKADFGNNAEMVKNLVVNISKKMS